MFFLTTILSISSIQNEDITNWYHLFTFLLQSSSIHMACNCNNIPHVSKNKLYLPSSQMVKSSWPVRKTKWLSWWRLASTKGSIQNYGRHVLDNFRNNHHDEITLVDMTMHLFLYHIKEIPCHLLVLLCREFIIFQIKSDCPRFLLPNLDSLPCKIFKAFINIKVRSKDSVCVKWTPFREIKYHSKRKLEG